MRIARATGRNAAVLKYDLLTALGAFACAGDKHAQRLVLRFVTLIVARYNWQIDELAVGQREIAALWSVDERTVKREMARLRDMGWLTVKRAAARGRVAVYGLGIETVLTATRSCWPNVGPDFASRMGAGEGAAQPSNVISFPAGGAAAGTAPGAWGQVQGLLQEENPALFAAWFAVLRPDYGADGSLCLRAPSRFHASFVATHHLSRLARLVQGVAPGITRISVAAEGG